MDERSNLPIVVVDIDNTVAEHFNRIKEYYDPVLDTIPYEKAHSIEAVMSYEAIPGSVDAINKISKKFQVYWLTARKPHLIEPTKKWLLNNNFIIDRLIFVELYNDKISHLITIQPELFVDDLKYDYFSQKPKVATEMIAQLNNNNIAYIAFKYNWKKILKILNCE
jgi:hypothetical protein